MARNRIAMVGAHNPLSYDDSMRLDQAVQLGLPEGHIEIINLEYGRDFLVERYRYLGVVLNSIFHTNAYDMQSPENLLLRRKDCLWSPLHSMERWRKRLISTGANVIVVWELSPMALSGWNLNELRGYRILTRNHRVTVYRRIP